MSKYFGKHHAVMQEREPIDKVNQIENCRAFTQSSLVFGGEYSVNDDEDVIVAKSNRCAAIGEL
jgi:hypothetical protein